MHLDADDEAGVAQERVLQLAEAEEFRFALVFCAGAGLAVALVEHHLFAVVGPAFDVGVGAEQLAHAAGGLGHPQELDVMAGVGFVHGGGDDGALVEGVHVAFDFLGRHRLVGQRDVEVGLGGVRLEGAGRVHAGEGGGAHEGRRLFDDGAHIGGDGDDVVRVDEADQAVEGGAESVRGAGRARDGRRRVLRERRWGLCRARAPWRACLKCC